MSGKADLRVSAYPREVAEACAAYIAETLGKTLETQPRASIAISGGSSPRPMFAALAVKEVDWSRVHFFWVDERCVPPHDDQSNFKMANEAILTPAKIPEFNIHRIFGELVPDEGAIRYIGEIEEFFKLDEGQLPVFDIVHRGMGADAHTASLFPGEPLIQNRAGIAAAVYVEKLQSHRVTLLPGVLLKARNTVLQVVGDDKADALRDVLSGPRDFLQFPCQIGTRDGGNAVWFVDRAATSEIR